MFWSVLSALSEAFHQEIALRRVADRRQRGSDATSDDHDGQHTDDYARVRQLLRETVSGYTPDGEIVDWIYQQRRLEP